MFEILIIFLIFDAGISIAYENFKQKVSYEKKLLKEMQKLSDFRETAKRDLEEFNAEISQFKSRYSDNLNMLHTFAKDNANKLSEICDSLQKNSGDSIKQIHTEYFDNFFKLKNHIDKQIDLYNKFLEQTEREGLNI